MWPLKWKLSACTFSWCYLFVKILENEICKFGRNLPLATFGSEGLKASMLVAYKIPKRYTDFRSSSTGSDPLRVLHSFLIPDRLLFAVITILILSHVFPDNGSALCYVEWVWQLTKFTRDTSPALGLKERCWMRLAWRHRQWVQKKRETWNIHRSNKRSWPFIGTMRSSTVHRFW